MRYSFRDLKKWSVETESGEKLGCVHNVIIETEGQLIAQYIVKTSLLGGDVYTISRDQIVRFEKGKMIVDDAVKEDKEESDMGSPVSDPEPVAMRE